MWDSKQARREQAVVLYGSGVPIAKIGEELGIGRVRAYELLREAGYAAGKAYGPRKQLDRQQVIDGYRRHGTIKHTALEFGVSQGRVRTILVEAGLVPATPRTYRPAKPVHRPVWARNNTGTPKTGSVVSQAITVALSGTPEVMSDTSLPLGSRFLTVQDRRAIADGLINGWSQTEIAKTIGKHRSTVSREIAAGRRDGSYMPHVADEAAATRRRRPRLGKLHPEINQALHDYVQDGLNQRHSPEQISGRLRAEFGDDRSMNVCHETIYQALYFQARGGLKKEVQQALRSGRCRRKTRGQRQKRERFTDPMINISDRPAEVEDRAVPGHWEGDLIIGKDSGSAIGTLVERTTRFTILLHLPNGRSAEAVRDAIIAATAELPDHLKRSLTWDQGAELARHVDIKIAADLDVYFCDPASPWQRGTNENTNGLLRQYFPKGTDLSVHGPERLREVADELNGRPRKTLGFATPAEALSKLVSTAA